MPGASLMPTRILHTLERLLDVLELQVDSLCDLSGDFQTGSRPGASPMAIDAVSVPYKGNAPAMSDLISGRLDFYFATLSDMLPSIKSGRLTALALTANERDPSFPGVQRCWSWDTRTSRP